MALGTWPKSFPGGISADTTLDATHKNLVLDVTTGGTDKTLTVPAASTLEDGEVYHARKDDAADGWVLLTGGYTYELRNQDQYIAIVSNGTVYRIFMAN